MCLPPTEGPKAPQTAAASRSNALTLRKAPEHNGNGQEYVVQSIVRYHGSLESLASAIRWDTVSEIRREYSSSSDDVYTFQARHVMSPVFGSKPVSARSVGPYRTGVCLRLTRPFTFEIQKTFLRVRFRPP